MNVFKANSTLESEFQNGIDVINSLLEPGSVLKNMLTTQQTTGLQRLKMSLLKANVRQSKGVHHIPKKLLTKVRSGDFISVALASQYGGMHVNQKWKNLKSAVTANSFLRKISMHHTKHGISDSNSAANSYAPPEWYNLDRAAQLKLADQLSWEKLMKWGIDIFQVDKLTNGNPLLFVGWAILASPYSQHAMIKTLRDKNQNRGDNDTDIKNMQGYHFIDKYEISQVCMVDFLRVIESNYVKDNPYHNSIHASDVLQTTHALLTGMNGKRFATSELELFSVLVGAAIHDVGHPGTNNNFQTNANSEMALIYNDIHVLENYHVSFAFRKILGKDGNPNLNIFKNMRQNDFIKCKKLITEAVLGTDMTQHFQKLNIVKNLPMENEWEEGEVESVSWELLSFFMHVADISNGAKPNSISVKWSDRVLDEFFQQGDKERKLGLPISPLCDRETTSRAVSQKGFVDYITRPCFEVLEKYIPEIGNVVMNIINDNSSFWDTELEKEKLNGMQDYNC